MMEKHANSEDFDLYALGALDGEEKQRFESHLRECPDCQAALAAAREDVLLMGLMVAPFAPAPSTRLSLLTRLRQEEGIGNRRSWDQSQRTRMPAVGLAWGFGIAAAVLMCAVLVLWSEHRESRSEVQQLRARLNDAQVLIAQKNAVLNVITIVMTAPDTVQVTLQRQPDSPAAEAHVSYNARLGTILYSAKLNPPQRDQSYQLWLVPASGAPVSAGLISPDQNQGIVVVHSPPGLVAKAFAVTVEPLGGKPQPTGPKILVGAAG